MKHDTQTEQRLERAVDKLCKQLPDRKAPADLYSRVMREVQLRKALPWWRKSFLHWPVAMQGLFVTAALITAKGVLMISDWCGVHVFTPAASVTQSSSVVQGASTLMSVSNQVSSQIAHMVPSSWMYGAALLVAMFYLVLFGIGVTTYKTLYAARGAAR